MIRNFIILYIILFSSCQNTQEEKFRNIDIIKFYETVSASNITILDVRTSQERAHGYINNSTHIDFYDDSFLDKVNLLNKENPIYIYCKVGGRSTKVSEKISELGFKEIYNLEGGFISWSGHNLPFEFSLENKSENLKQGFTKADIDSILSLKNKTLIYISTKWCAPCREMNPIVEKLKRELPNHLQIINIDLDHNFFVKEMYDISSIPLFVLYENNKEVWRKNGIIAYSEIAEKL